MNLLEMLREVGIRPRHSRQGDQKLLCPKCSSTRKNQTDPCLSLTVTGDHPNERAVWFCHHCNWRDWTGTGRWARIKGAHQKQYRRPVVQPVPPQKSVLDWLGNRGVPPHIVQEYGIWAARVWMPQSQQKEAVICFPIRKHGEIVNMKYREPIKKWFRQEKDAEPAPFGYDDIVGQDVIWIVEGEIDKLSLAVVGTKECMSVPAGAPGPRKDGSIPELPDDSPKFAWIDVCFDDLEKARRIVIAVDADVPGQILRAEIIRRVGREKCWLVDWPTIGGEQINDANAMLMVAGEEALREILDQARPVPADGEITVTDMWSEIRQMHLEEKVDWYSTGFPAIDDVYRVLRKQVTVVTGFPHDGKSSFLDQIMVNMALNLDWRFGIYSPETDPPRHVVSLLEKAARAPFFQGPGRRMDWAEVDAFRPWLEQHFHFLRWDRKPKQPGRPDLAWIIDRAEYMVRRYGIDGLVVDPFNRIRAGDHARETDFVLDLMDEFQAMAKRTSTHIWIVAHPAKQLRDKSGKRPAKLQLQDVSGSSHWDNCTDMGLLVRRIWDHPDGGPYQPRETPVEVECLKARDKHSGQKGGTGLFKWNWSDGTYSSLPGLPLPAGRAEGPPPAPGGYDY